MKKFYLIVATFGFLLASGVSLAEEDVASSGALSVAAYPRVELAALLESASKKSGQVFIVDARVPPTVVVGQPKARDIDYSTLLSILRNNALAAVTVGNTISVVPVATIRQFPLPVLFEDDESIDGEEWVTRVVQLKNAPAAMMVPIMRPLLPQQGHLAANAASNSLIIADRYANVRRVTKMIMELDSRTPAQVD